MTSPALFDFARAMFVKKLADKRPAGRKRPVSAAYRNTREFLCPRQMFVFIHLPLVYEEIREV